MDMTFLVSSPRPRSGCQSQNAGSNRERKPLVLRELTGKIILQPQTNVKAARPFVGRLWWEKVAQFTVPFQTPAYTWISLAKS